MTSCEALSLTSGGACNYRQAGSRLGRARALAGSTCRHPGSDGCPRPGDEIMTTRRATPEDSEAIAQIYNQGIEDRVATFETRRRTADDVRAWFDGAHPVVVVEEDGQVIAFGATFAYRPRDWYVG